MCGGKRRKRNAARKADAATQVTLAPTGASMTLSLGHTHVCGRSMSSRCCPDHMNTLVGHDHSRVVSPIREET